MLGYISSRLGSSKVNSSGRNQFAVVGSHSLVSPGGTERRPCAIGGTFDGRRHIRPTSFLSRLRIYRTSPRLIRASTRRVDPPSAELSASSFLHWPRCCSSDVISS